MFGGKKFNPDKDIPDLTGKTILVTGGTIIYSIANTKGTLLTEVLY